MSKVGRKKVEGGVRRMWTVPPDIDAVIQERGTKWMWTSLRAIIAYESVVINANDAKDVSVSE